jgi:hypothetical protein
MIRQVLIAMGAGWLQRHRQQVMTYLLEENCVLKAQFGSRRLRLTDTKRRRLATRAYPLRRQRLKTEEDAKKENAFQGSAQTKKVQDVPKALLGRRNRTALLVQPDGVEAYDIIDTEVVGRIVALHVGVPAIIHPLPRDRE